MANYLSYHRMYSQAPPSPSVFQPPHSSVDAVECQLPVLAEQIQVIHTHVARSAILSPKGDTVTSMKPVNDIVECCHIPSLEAIWELDTC